MVKIEINDINVEPEELAILDVKEYEEMPTFFAIYPTFYNCRILFSPIVIQRMFQWLIKTGYIKIDGKVTMKIRNLERVYIVTS